MSKLDLTKILVGKKVGWIALTPDTGKVIGHANTLKEVLKVAKGARISNPTVFKIGQFDSAFVG